MSKKYKVKIIKIKETDYISSYESYLIRKNGTKGEWKYIGNPIGKERYVYSVYENDKYFIGFQLLTKGISRIISNIENRLKQNNIKYDDILRFKNNYSKDEPNDYLWELNLSKDKTKNDLFILRSTINVLKIFADNSVNFNNRWLGIFPNNILNTSIIHHYCFIDYNPVTFGKETIIEEAHVEEIQQKDFDLILKNFTKAWNKYLTKEIKRLEETQIKE